MLAEVVLTPESFMPNTVFSSLSVTVSVAAVTPRRPRWLVPRSASLRSAATCLKPARAPTPFMMSDVPATGLLSVLLPPNM
ncbi:hypothetical protein D3C87_2123800 [compost metagenome]